jgi:MFS family permease
MSASPFSYRDFRFYFGARFLSTLATFALVVAMQWHVYDLARVQYKLSISASAFQVSLLGLAQFAALLLFFLPAGYAVDRFDRRILARIGIGFEILCVIILYNFVSAPTHSIYAIISVAALLGLGRAFAAPAMQSIGPSLVPADVLPTAIAWNSIAWQSAAVGGPVLVGLLLAHGGIRLVCSFCGILLGIALLMSLFIRFIPRVPRPENGPWQTVLEGLRYTIKNKMVFGAISLDLFAVLLGGATAMLPVFARDILLVGEDGFGWLRAAPALGAAGVALYLTQRPLRRRVGPRMFACVGVFGLATIVFGLSKVFWLSMVALIVLGAADMISVYIRSSLVQLHTADAMRGRVSSVNTLFIGASNELGEAQSGITALLLGPVGAVVFGGVGALLVTVLWARWFPDLRSADSLELPVSLKA